MTAYLIQDAVIGLKSELPPAVTGPAGVGPAFGLYLAADTGEWYVNTGAAWSKIGQVGIPVDVSGNVTMKGTLTSTSTSAPAPTAGSAGGTSPPVPALVAGSNDVAGSITFGSGSGTPTAGDQVVVAFGAAYAATPKAVMVVPGNAATAAKSPAYISALSASGFTLALNTAPAISQANTIYKFYYWVVA